MKIIELIYKYYLSIEGSLRAENFKNVGSQIAGNFISGLISNLLILLWLDRFNSKLTRDGRYLSKADAVQIILEWLHRLAGTVSFETF